MSWCSCSWVTYLGGREVIRVPIHSYEQPAVREEPQALVCGRGGDGLADVAVWDLARGVGHGEAVARSFAHHFLQPADAVGVRVGFNPRDAVLDPGYHAGGQPGDEGQVVQLEKKVEGAGGIGIGD